MKENDLRDALSKRLGSTRGVNEWLYTTMPALGNRTPLEALDDVFWCEVLVMDILPTIGCPVYTKTVKRNGHTMIAKRNKDVSLYYVSV